MEVRPNTRATPRKPVARRASSLLSRWLSEAIPPERDAKTDVSAGIIKSAHDDSLSGNNERGGKQPVGFASLKPRLSLDDALSGNVHSIISITVGMVRGCCNSRRVTYGAQ